MKLATVVALVAALAVAPVGAEARGRSGGARGSGHATSSRGHGSHHATSGGGHGGHPKASGVRRDQHGKIARSEKAKHDFRKDHACPSTGRTSGACPGYEVDHVRPLACGGPDASSNMQWLSKAQNRSKGARCDR